MNKTLKIPLGGLLQKIQIRTHDAALPVLLFLHGGPGVVNRHSIMTIHADLLNTFTLVGWDQRGTGGSFWGCKRETLTVSRLTDDAAELAEYLCKCFEKDKIFIIGGSWGSELGTYLVYRYPQRIAAYVGFGQVVDGALNETLSYEFALNAAKEADSSGDLNGTITVANGGTSYDKKPGGNSLWSEGSSGEYVFMAGSKAYTSNSGGTDDDLIIGTSGDTNAKVQLTSGTFSNTQTSYSLEGDATVANAYGSPGIDISIDGTLTLDESFYLLTSAKLTGVEGAKIILKQGKGIYFTLGNIAGKNFYTAEGKPYEADSIIVTTGNQTFAWDDGLGGWKGSGAELDPIELIDPPTDAVFEIEGFEEVVKVDGVYTLYKKTGGDVPVSLTEDFDSYKWELDGKELSTKSTLTLNPRTLDEKTQTLTVFVTKDGVVYSKEVTFTVAYEATGN